MAGRKPANIDWELVDKHLRAQCDGVGIAGILGVHPETLYDACKRDHKTNFSAYSQIKKAEGKELLRQKQMEVALDGDKTMLVRLGKQYLEQSDKVSQNIDQTNKTPLPQMTEEELTEEIKRLERIRDIGKVE